MAVTLTLKPDPCTPLHRRIYEEWREGILSGRFRRGERVPSTRELATTLGVARSTVTAAYDQLTAEGYFSSARGSGTFVCRELPESLLHAHRPVAPGRTADTPAPYAPIRLSRYAAELGDPRLLQPPVPADWLRFSHWRPDLAHFPFAIWHRLMNRHLGSTAGVLFDYADSPAGFEPLRREIAAYLARSRAVTCDPAQVLIVNGSQQGLDLCTRVLLDRGDEVALENPGYQGARQIFQAHGARLSPAAMDADGVIPSTLSPRARLVYVTPSHQFPTGVSMSVARRLELIEWARRHGAVIVEDDYDSEYRYSGAPLPAMQGLAKGAPVFYIGTFSKVMFPGMRIGYLIVPPALAAIFQRAKWLVDRQTPLLEQAALADFLREGHLERHTRKMRRLYGRRREIMVATLFKYFGDKAQVLGDQAGMHALVRFEDDEIAVRAAANKVQLASSEGYYQGEAPKNEFVFGFSCVTEAHIREAIRRLASP